MMGAAVAAGLAIGVTPNFDMRTDGASTTATASTVSFDLCDAGGGGDCVIDGDTFRLGGERIRIADIDAPETHPPRCSSEAELGARDRAAARLAQRWPDRA